MDENGEEISKEGENELLHSGDVNEAQSERSFYI